MRQQLLEGHGNHVKEETAKYHRPLDQHYKLKPKGILNNHKWNPPKNKLTSTLQRPKKIAEEGEGGNKLSQYRKNEKIRPLSLSSILSDLWYMQYGMLAEE